MASNRIRKAPLVACFALSAITQAVLAQTAPSPSTAASGNAGAAACATDSGASSPTSAPRTAACAPTSGADAATPTKLAQASQPSQQKDPPSKEAASAPGTQLETIVVSANKREERLQDVPATVSVLQPQQLEQQRILSMEDLQRAVPTVQGSGNGMSIRGYGATSFAPTAEGAVGIVIDGVSMGGSSETPPNLFDVERVEVLEGSQGTLFGKNASAGIVNIVTVAPDPRKFGGHVRLEGRERRSGGLQGALNLPVNEQLAFRIAAGVVQEPEIVHNLPDDSWDGVRRTNVRARMRWVPSSAFRLDLSVDDSKNELRGGTPIVFYQTTAGSPLTGALRACGVEVGEENTKGCAGEGYKRTDESRGASAQLDWFLDGFTLSSITALRKALSDTKANELDGLNVPVPSVVQAPLFKEFRNTSQEFRVVSPDFVSGNFVAGAFYYDQDIEGGSARKIIPPGLPPGVFLGDTKQQEGNTRSVAVFAQGLYRVNKELAFNLGLRFGREEVSTKASGARLPGAVLPVIAANLNPVDATLDDTYTSYKGGAEYSFTPDHMAYVLYTRGYKGPVVNDVLPSPDTAVIVRPEIPKTWELGLKNTFLSGRFGLNFSIYDTEATDFQTTVLDPVTLSFVTGNAPSATLKGGSVSFYGWVTPDLLVNGGVAYMKTETDRGGIGATGNDPTTRANLAATYNFGLMGMRASVGADVTYEDRPAEDPTAPLAWAHKATIVGAQFGIRSPNGMWGLTLNARNLFDKFDPAGRSAYFLGQFVGDTGAAFQSFKPESRRVVGLTFDAKF